MLTHGVVNQRKNRERLDRLAPATMLDYRKVLDDDSIDIVTYQRRTTGMPR